MTTATSRSSGGLRSRQALPVRPNCGNWRLLVVAGFAAIFLAACGIGGDDDPEPTATAPTDVFSIVTPTPGAPPQADVPAPVAGQQTYVVREGDSLSVIADRFGVTQDAIQRANDITDPNSLFAGQEIVIPAPEP